MASSLALRRLSAGNGIFRPLRSLAATPGSLTRGFNSNSQMARVDDDDDRGENRVSRRGREFPAFFSDVFDPFAPTRSVGQLINLMDQFMDSPLLSATRGMGPGPIRRAWDVKEDENALHLKVDMPGLGKEDVKVSVEDNALVIKGEAANEDDDQQATRRYSSRIELTPSAYKLDGIKAEMKNGVLRVSVPKVTEDEKKDVFQVQIE